MKKIFLYITLLFLFGCNKLNIISDVNFNKETRPNVLIISIDDLKDWVGFLNGYEGKVHTPNIDKLASQGVA
ncbi:MAG: sulfatase, partial [Flavobacteriaceae bacterium]|nr:sulfatase [Flavobacteriaceae bacterium]